MYSNPGYDPQPLSTGTNSQIQAAWKALTTDPEKPLVAHAFQDLYLPGSTFKTVTASGALENGWPPEKLWPNPHRLDLPLTTEQIKNFGDSYCIGGARVVTMEQAFIDSCNVPFAEIGVALGAPKLSSQAYAYGFCRTNPNISPACQNETIPFILPWAPDNVITNPMHLALVAGAIGNGGVMPAPRLVTEVRDATGQTVREFPDTVYGHPLSPASARALREMMVEVVEQGTGYAAQIEGTVVAGKTGTATNGPSRPPNAWFTSFAPAGPGQTPRIAVAVIVLDGGDMGNEATGGRVAAPIAKEVMEAYLAI
jgi:peptidoglycan glycosyltransferase